MIAAETLSDPMSAIPYFEKSLEYNPNSTQALHELARAYAAVGSEEGESSTLRRLLIVERSPYAQIRGVPELVDTNYAKAHATFGRKFLAQENYTRARDEFRHAIENLEEWRSHDDFLEAMRVGGRLSEEEERSNLELLSDCYTGVAEACTGLGNSAGAREARENAERIAALSDQ